MSFNHGPDCSNKLKIIAKLDEPNDNKVLDYEVIKQLNMSVQLLLQCVTLFTFSIADDSATKIFIFSFSHRGFAVVANRHPG